MYPFLNSVPEDAVDVDDDAAATAAESESHSHREKHEARKQKRLEKQQRLREIARQGREGRVWIEGSTTDKLRRDVQTGGPQISLDPNGT